MSSPDAELDRAWQSFLALPFPAAAGRDEVVDLAAYDASIAGIVSRLVNGGRLPDELAEELRPDVELRRRIAELGDPLVTEYLERLEDLIALSVRVGVSRRVARS